MNEAAEVPALPAILTAVAPDRRRRNHSDRLVGTCCGCVRFYERVHAPTLGTTLGTACIAIASMIYFSALGTRPVLHELLHHRFHHGDNTCHLMVLVRAALLRDRSENNGRSADGSFINSTITNELTLRKFHRLAGGTARISTFKERSASSVTLPSSALSRPERPCVPIIRRSGRISATAREMTSIGPPSSTRRDHPPPL